MSNNHINNVSNNKNNNNGYRSLTDNIQLNNNTNTSGTQNRRNLIPLEDEDNRYRSGFRGGNVMVQRFSGNGFLSNPFQNSFPKVVSNQLGQGFGIIGNFPLTNINNKELNIRNNNNNNNDIPTGLIGKNIPKIIVPAPIYTNVIDEDSIDTCCHLSKVVVQVIQQTLVKLLEAILLSNEILIDWQVNNKNQFDFQGRVFTNSSSEFIIKIYRLKQKDKDNNISVVEIRKVCGDEFGYYKFEELLLNKLQDEKILPKQFGTSSMFAPLSMDFGSLTLEDEDEDDEMNEITELSDSDLMSTQEDDDEFDENYCETMLETLYSKDSYREEYMHDAYQLSTCLKKDDNRSKNMINYILKNESNKLIEGVLAPIKSNKLFCAFIIVHILESISVLLSNTDVKSKLAIPKTFKHDIENIQKTWSNTNGIQNNLGSITVQFTRSQQVERRCEEILQLIE